MDVLFLENASFGLFGFDVGRRGIDEYVLQVIGFEGFFEVISASCVALAQGVLIKLDRILEAG